MMGIFEILLHSLMAVWKEVRINSKFGRSILRVWGLEGKIEEQERNEGKKVNPY